MVNRFNEVMNLQENIQRIKEVMGLKSDISEVSDEGYKLIQKNYSESRLIMTKNDFIEFKPMSIKDQEVRAKPKGLWYGVGTSWIDWVRSEMPEWEVDNVFKIDIDESKVKIIRNIEELIEFDEEYGLEFEKYVGLGWRNIDWAKVANDWGGIEISPYIYEARMDFNWYYGWDVASGCIWSDGIITKIEKII